MDQRNEDNSEQVALGGQLVAQSPHPLVTTVVRQGAGSYAVLAGEDAEPGPMAWSEMLGQVAALTYDGKPRTDPFSRVVAVEILAGDNGSWNVVVDRTEVHRALCFDEVLGLIARLTFPSYRVPGKPLFLRKGATK